MKYQKVFIMYEKVNKKLITFADIEIEKREFHSLKNSIFLKELDFIKTIISKQVSCGEKILY